MPRTLVILPDEVRSGAAAEDNWIQTIAKDVKMKKPRRIQQLAREKLGDRHSDEVTELLYRAGRDKTLVRSPVGHSE